VSAFGEVVQALIGSEAGLANELDGSSAAPVPSVDSRPGTVAGARAWTAPDAGGHGQVSVHRDVLRGVAAGMRSDLQDLEGSVRWLDSVRRGEGISITGNAGLVAGWPTAAGFNGNASAALAGIVRASQQSGTAHQGTSSRLVTSAAAYDQSESDNLRAARSVGTSLYSVASLVASYGTGGRPAAAALGAQPSYPVKTHAVSGFSGAGMSAGTVMEILHGLTPGEVSAAGAAHTRLGSTLDTVAGRLTANAHTLAQNWSGSAAQAAMGQFQQLHNHMVTLAQQALQVGSVLSWLGGEVLPRFASLPDPRVSATSLVLDDVVTGTILGGPVGGIVGAGTGLLDELDGSAQAAADHAARQYIAKLSGYLVIADQSLPNTVGAVPAPAGGRGAAPAATVPVAGGVGAGGSGTGVRLPSGEGTATPAGAGGGRASASRAGGAAGGAGATGRTGAAAAPPSSLQGVTIPGGQPSAPAGATSLLGRTSPLSGSGGLSGGLPGSVTGVPGAAPPLSQVTETLDDTTVPAVGTVNGEVGGQVGGEMPGNVLPGASGTATWLAEDEPGGPSGSSGLPAADSPVAGDVIGAQSLQAESDSALTGTDESAVAPDMAGFPVLGTGGAAQPDGQERTRQAWLHDDDLWRLSVTLVPPVVDE
jgi:uncharacterized protein YukE